MTTRYRARLRALRDEAAALLGAVWTFALRADVPTLAASFAFSAIFAIGPLLSLTLIGLSMLPGEMFRRGLDHVARAVLPSVSQPFLDLLASQLHRASNPWLVVASVFGLLWTLSSASDAVVTALETIGRRDRRPWWKRRVRAAMLGLAVAGALAVASIAVALGPSVARFLGRLTGLPLAVFIPLASRWFRLPLVAVSFTGLCQTYYRASTLEPPTRGHAAAGAVFAGALATGASAALSAWFAIAPRMGGGYGAATAFFAVLLWLYVLGLTLCLGACLAHAVGHGAAPEPKG